MALQLQSTSRTSNLFKDLASDNEEQVELEDQDSDDSDTGNAYPLQSFAKRVRGRGRTKNGIFQFSHSHPQSQTHQLRIKSRPGIPFLAGEHVPEYPRQNLVVTKATLSGDTPDIEPVDEVKLNRFGVYFLVILCPWSLISHAPSFELSYTGLSNHWILLILLTMVVFNTFIIVSHVWVELSINRIVCGQPLLGVNGLQQNMNNF